MAFRWPGVSLPMIRSLRLHLADTVPLTIVIGVAIGAALTEFLTAQVGLSSRLALEMVVLASLQICAPVAVNLVWISRAASLQVAQSAYRQWKDIQPDSPKNSDTDERRSEVLTATGTVMLLLPYCVGAMILAAILFTPRSDVQAEIRYTLNVLPINELFQCLGRTVVMVLLIQLICHRKGRQLRASMDELPFLISDAIVESFFSLITVEAFWSIFIDPLRLTA